jgi:hypothetical protein
LREVLDAQERTLVIGPPHVVRQAHPGAIPDVVGTNSDDPAVTVVSEALGTGSLPCRWECVVVTDVDAPRQRFIAATEACLPGGRVVVVGSQSCEPAIAPGMELEHRARSRGVVVTAVRVPG